MMRNKNPKRIALLVSLALVMFCSVSLGTSLASSYVPYSVTKTPNSSQFNFAGNYTPPDWEVDGNPNNNTWKDVPVLATFGRNDNASVKVIRGNVAIFFMFTVTDTIMLYEPGGIDDSINHSDSVELYLCTKLDEGNQPQTDDYQFFMSVDGRMRVRQGNGGGWGNSSLLTKRAITLAGNSTINNGTAENDVGYSIELMIPYSQIAVTKDSPIGISLGHVDKVGLNNISGTDYAWYGWNFGSFVNPQVPANYIALDKDNNLSSISAMEKAPVTIIGKVTDKTTNDDVSGVTVSIDGKTATTGADGSYSVANVNCNINQHITFAKANYVTTEATLNRTDLRASAGGSYTKNATILKESDIQNVTLTGKVENVFDGAVENAKVSIVGFNDVYAHTAANGTFTLNNVPMIEGKDFEIKVEKLGYHTQVQYRAYSLRDVGTLNLSYAGDTVRIGGEKGINGFDTEIVRTINGIRLVGVTDTLFDVGFETHGEKLELFIDTKVSQATRGATDVRYDFYADGTVGVDNYGGSFTTANISYTVTHNDNPNNGATVVIEIPYATLNVSAKDVIGFTAGVWGTNTVENRADWNGMGFLDYGFRAPEIPQNYVRIAPDNTMYMAVNNDATVIVKGLTSPGATVTVQGNSVVATTGEYKIITSKPTANISITFSMFGYLTHTETITPADYTTAIAKVVNHTMQQKLVTVSGVVRDGEGNTVSAVKVTLGTDVTTTNEFGEYTFTSVPTLADIAITAEKEGYFNYSNTITATNLFNAVDQQYEYNIAIVIDGAVRSIEGVVSNIINEDIEGVTVKVLTTNIQTTTNADGEFTLLDVPASNYTIEFSKAGYVTKTVDVINSTTDMGEIDLWLAYAEMGAFAGNDRIGPAFGFVTRSSEGFEFMFDVRAEIFEVDSCIELFVDSKTTATTRNATDYIFRLRPDGTVDIDNFGGANNQLQACTVVVSGDRKIVTFTLRYSFLDIACTDVIGVSLGLFKQFNPGPNNDGVWDGWVYFTGNSAVENNFVKPENPEDYIRISPENILYWARNNNAIDLTGYTYRFAREGNDNADGFFGTITRDETQISMNFLTFGNFTDSEFVMIYLNAGAPGADGWDNFSNNSYQFKVYGNGKIYYRKANRPWWNTLKPDEATKTLPDITINKANGITTFTVNIAYTTINIDASTTFGFCMSQASDVDAGHPDYLFYGGPFLYGNLGVPDPAREGTYLQMAPNGVVTKR